MKISSLDTDRAADTLCRMVGCIDAIVSDEELIKLIKKKVQLPPDAGEAELTAAGIGRISSILPLLLRKHRREVYGILAALEEKTPEEIAKQSFITTARQIRDICSDEDLGDFFSSCAR